MADPTPPPITDPQTHDAYGSTDPNVNAVDNAPVAGDAPTDNQRLLARQTPSGTSRGVQQLGGPSLQADSSSKQITVTDAVPQVLMGSQPTFGEGFYVTRSGKDVTITTDPADFIFNSNQNVFKIANTNTATLSVNFPNHTGTGADDIATLTIPHGLSYSPIVNVYLQNAVTGGYSPIADGSIVPAGASFQLSAGAPPAAAQVIVMYWEISTDNTNIYITYRRAYSMGGAYGTGTIVQTFNFKYYILQETAN